MSLSELAVMASKIQRDIDDIAAVMKRLALQCAERGVGNLFPDEQNEFEDSLIDASERIQKLTTLGGRLR